MVELHNYTPASGTKNKLLNWETLNRYGIEHTPGITCFIGCIVALILLLGFLSLYFLLWSKLSWASPSNGHVLILIWDIGYEIFVALWRCNHIKATVYWKWGPPGGGSVLPWSLKIMHSSPRLPANNFLVSLKVFAFAPQIPKISSASLQIPKNISQFSLKCIYLSIWSNHILKNYEAI